MSSPKKSRDNPEDDPGLPWDELQRARNRLNSKRTRERERSQIETLEAQKERLWVSNDAIKYQNAQYREAIKSIRDPNSIIRRQDVDSHALRAPSIQDRPSVAQQNQSHTTSMRLAPSFRDPVGLGSIQSLLPTSASSRQGGHHHLASLMLAAREGSGGNPFYPLNPLSQLQYDSLSSASLGGALNPTIGDFSSFGLNNAARPSNLPTSNFHLFQNARLSHLHRLVPQTETSIGLNPVGIPESLMNRTGERTSPVVENEARQQQDEEVKQRKKRHRNS